MCLKIDRLLCQFEVPSSKSGSWSSQNLTRRSLQIALHAGADVVPQAQSRVRSPRWCICSSSSFGSGALVQDPCTPCLEVPKPSPPPRPSQPVHFSGSDLALWPQLAVVSMAARDEGRGTGSARRDERLPRTSSFLRAARTWKTEHYSTNPSSGSCCSASASCLVRQWLPVHATVMEVVGSFPVFLREGGLGSWDNSRPRPVSWRCLRNIQPVA